MASVLVLAFARGALAADDSPAENSVYNYAGHMTFTVEGMSDLADETAADLTNFPLRVLINEQMVQGGFWYSFLHNGTNDLVFLDTKGQTLSYEIETWNTLGDSTFWVKVPRMRDGTQIMMCWGLRDGCKEPAKNNPTDVWSDDYVGVWHMDEKVDEAGAKAQTQAVDASAHGHNLVPRIGPEGVYYTQTSTAGVFGNARVNDTSKRYKKQGSYFEMADTENLALDGVFTLSFWIKFDAYANYPHLAARRSSAKGNVGFQIDLNVSDRKQLIARGDTQTGGYNTIVDTEFKDLGFTHLAFVYDNTNVSIYANGVCKVDKMTIGKASDNGLPIVIGNKCDGTEQSVWGKYDEVRLCRGAKSAEWIAAEFAQTNSDFCVASSVVNDATAVLKNDWVREPSITQAVWEGRGPSQDDFDIVPKHGTNVTVVVYNRATGEMAASNEFAKVEFPQSGGSYRVVITVAQSGSESDGYWGSLEYTLGYRVAEHEGTHEFGDNVARILLGNDDYTVEGGEVEWQSYDDEDRESGSPYWRHLDSNGNDASTTYDDYWSDSLDFNLGGGTHHIYRHGDGIDRLWDLRDIRIGNTFHNGEDLWERTGKDEQYVEGLENDQNYLPWNPESQRVLNQRWEPGMPVEGRHRYVSHIVMQNTTNAAVTSTCYTNGIGTIYFDAVNGWTDNITNANGEANYRLVVEIATCSAEDPNLPPTEQNIAFMAPETIEEADADLAPFWNAKWERCTNLRVLYCDGDECTDLGTTNAVDLKITEGGSYECFYRVIVPVNLTPATGGIRFRIRRETMDPKQALFPDGTAYILLDNIICSEPAARVQLTPYGKYFPEKKRKTDIVQGWEGAFIPAYPSVTDKVFGRAKATMPDGSAAPADIISAATMHYRWHYLDQQTTDWLEADLVPGTLVSRDPLKLPPFQGDIDFWFDAVQHGHYYVYADYSGADLGLGKTGYSEEVPAVTNRADGADWFVRTREGKSNYGEMKLLVRETEKAPVVEYSLSVMQDSLWRGFYRMTNVYDSIRWRIEARNKQEDGAKDWNWSTNRWYVTDWTDSPPTFPAAGRMSEGTTNSWSRMTCDMQTGYLMFQVDETSLGVTAIHSDHQAFDTWHDAAKGYFSGSSSDTNSMSGTSADVREYSAVYGSWADTPATNANWQLDFNDHTIGESERFKGYSMFADFKDYFKAWQIGKGMWVYGKYLEPESHVALQMAGCGEGYAEFSNRTIIGDDWPRGIESVSFHSRIAQEIALEHAVFYADADVAAKSMTNYTFMTRTCFDQKNNEGFSGNAALSLFSYHQKAGAYEARWEQIASTEANKAGEVLGPKPDGQRLVIVRWTWNGKTYEQKELIATTNHVFDSWKVPMPLMNGNATTNNLMPFLISTYHSDEATYVIAAVQIKKTGSGQTLKGEGVGPTDVISNADKNWFCVAYKDTDRKRLKFGSYGVMSSNCEGMFVTPQFSKNPVWPQYIKSIEMTDRYDVSTWNQCAAMLLKNYAYADFTKYSCLDDLVFDEDSGYNGWTMDRDYPGRNTAFYAIDAYGKPTDNFGLVFVKPNYQTVDVLAKPLNSTEAWDVEKHCIGQVEVNDFGTPGREPDHKPMFYYTSDSVLRLQTGGTLNDYRTDVVINDIEIRQWRGYDSSKSTSQTTRDDHTNFVFTCGWITNGAAQLSAKRTPVGTPCSIRSPLFDRDFGNGEGLGSISFSYREPQSNIVLLVQFATNVTGSSMLKSMTYSTETNATGNAGWCTAARLSHKELWQDIPKTNPDGTKTSTIPFGYHGAKGLMRIIVDPELVKEVSGLSWTNTLKFGAIDITSVICYDEPGLDKGCWWGWNLQAIGDSTDSQNRMYLPDKPTVVPYDFFGQSLALNNSVTADTNPAEAGRFGKHMPFLQSPTFTNAVIGQISFKARKYELSDYAPDAQVVVYGADRNPDALADDKDWIYIAAFPITNTIYTTYTCKTDTQNFYALRLAVVDVDGTPERPEDPKWKTDPQRVLLDEVTISEAVRAMLAFRNVGAFRSDLDKNNYVTGVTTRVEQPLCNENWGIQAEVFATMLGDEIDKTYTPRVKLHWYVSKYDELTKETWGWANWKKFETGSAMLAQAEGSNYVYRSSYSAAPAAVMQAQSDPGTVVQYMLEVEYKRISSPLPGEEPKESLVTNWLDSASWTVPEWYAPVDYNSDAKYGAGKTFAAFTILDTVAPGWAWINEANVFGKYDKYFDNSDKEFQYVEVCVPMEADLSGWRLRMLEAGLYNNTVVTNWIARFGSGKLKGTKTDNIGARYNKVFRCVGNKESSQMTYANGTLDGIWSFSNYGTYSVFEKEGSLDYICSMTIPFGIQLVRPSGIIESSVVVMGTNKWEKLGVHDYDPTNIVRLLNQNVPGSKFFYAAEDCCGTFRSGSVTNGKGESASVWTNDWACSPGYINTNWGGKVEQKIDPLHPSPHGDSIIVYANLDLSGGPIHQFVGGEGSLATNTTELLILPRGGEGTNILYTVDPWYELAYVMTNDKPEWTYVARMRRYATTVGKGASNNVNVVAKAQVDSILSGEYGLTKDNPYTPAVMRWLVDGCDAYGNSFAKYDSGNIALADYVAYNRLTTNQMTLTQMYWLDMDPTVSNLEFCAGMIKTWPEKALDEPVEEGYEGQNVLTNVKMRVYMAISNRVEAVKGPDGIPRWVWSPYILRGLDPAFTSWNYADDIDSSSWTSETFKVTGILANGLTSEKNQKQWIPLRWFVFDEDSFRPEKDALQFTTDVEIVDPHTKSSAGWNSWREWYEANPGKWAPVFNSWALDTQLSQFRIEVLQPTNFLKKAVAP